MHGRVSQRPTRGQVVAGREIGCAAPYVAVIQADGKFVIPRLHLRKIADNTFTLAIEATPHGTCSVKFSAILRALADWRHARA